MMRKIVKPITTQDGTSTKTTHPAFGQIVACRRQGRTNLYGSDFTSGATIAITIRQSSLFRDLSHDRYYGENSLIEVEVTEAQWANFVSAMNIGFGPPCTIRHVGGEEMPGIPDPIDRNKQFSDEYKRKLDDSVTGLQGILNTMDQMGLPKGKTATLREQLERTIREITSNMPFVAKSFGEMMEKTTETAKTEIHGYMLNAITSSGIAALQDKNTLPLLIERTDGEVKEIIDATPTAGQHGSTE
jgi:hypothetical protein